VDPDPAFQVNMDPDLAFNMNADPDPGKKLKKQNKIPTQIKW
jgi:hypothetical protein